MWKDVRVYACACTCARTMRANNKKGRPKRTSLKILFTCHLRGFFGLRNSVEIIIIACRGNPMKNSGHIM